MTDGIKTWNDVYDVMKDKGFIKSSLFTREDIKSVYAREIWNAAIEEAANQVGGYSKEIILKLKVA